MKYIADFSDWQEGIDFSEIAKHFDGVIVKIAEGAKETNCWYDFVTQAEEQGLQWGVYLYSHATTTMAAEREAQEVICLLQELDEPPPLGVWFDVESPEIVGENGTFPIPAERITAFCSSFISTCNKDGLEAGIYAPAWVLRDRINTHALASYVPYWVSEPGAAFCSLDGLINVAGWQYRVDDYPINDHYVDASEWYK